MAVKLDRIPPVLYQSAKRKETVISVDAELGPRQSELDKARMACIICGAIYRNEPCPENCEIRQLLEENGKL